jgi:hypothetical protein
MYSEKGYYYILSVIFTSLTVLTKVPGAMIGIPMIYLAFNKYGSKVFKKPSMIMFPVVVFSPVIAYFSFLGMVAEQRFVSGIGSNVILPNLISSVFSGETIKYLTVQFAGKVFTLPGAILFSMWLTYKLCKGEYVYYAWGLAAFLHVLLIDSVIHLDYYLIFITPIISIFMGIAASKLINRNIKPAVIVLISIMLLNFAVFAKDVYNIERKFLTLGKHVEQITNPSDIIIIGNDSPELLYTSWRKGWRLFGKGLTEENIKALVNSGASYFIPYDPLPDDLKAFLDSRYKRIDFEDGYYLYELNKE